jgi:hypothetical protein
MSNKVSTDLFELICSLTKSEKRYFKIFSSRHTIGQENNYIKLFDFIDQMSEYDESSVFKEFDGQSFLNKFSITKGRLYDNVLRSLDSFYAQSSIESQIFRLIHSADILYKKSLYDQCLKLLRSASKLAKKHERFTLLLEIHLKKKRLVENRGYMNMKESEIDGFWSDEKLELERIGQYFKFWHTKSKLFYLLNKSGRARNEEEIQLFQSVIAELKKVDLSNAYFDTKYLYFHIHSAYHFALGNLNESFEFLKKNVQLFQSNKAKIIEEPNIYYSILTNAIYIASRIGNQQVQKDYLKELKEFPETYKIVLNEDLDIKLFSSTMSLELSLLSQTGDFEEIVSYVPKINEAYRLYGEKVSSLRRAYLNFKVSNAYFAVENWNEALKWNNFILNDQELDKKDDILCFAHIMNIIIHFELDNRRLLPYALKATKRLLKSRNKTYEFERVFLKHINKLIAAPDIFTFQEKLDVIYLELEKLAENPMENIAFEYFDFMSWIEGKRKNCSYAKIIKLNRA